MYYKHNTEARSRNHCYRGKAINIIYYECVCSLSNPASDAYAPYYSHLFPGWLYTIFHIIS